MIVLKGATPLTGQNPVNIVFRAEFTIPAGVDVNDPNELKALLSFVGGVFWSEGNDLANCFITGIL